MALFYTAPRRLRKLILLAASYWFLHGLERALCGPAADADRDRLRRRPLIERTAHARRRKLLLVASLAANLGFLGFFKYYNFGAATVAALLGRPETDFALHIILPLGISFHTFQSISYVVDVYRGNRRRSPSR